MKRNDFAKLAPRIRTFIAEPQQIIEDKRNGARYTLLEKEAEGWLCSRAGRGTFKGLYLLTHEDLIEHFDVIVVEKDDSDDSGDDNDDYEDVDF